MNLHQIVSGAIGVINPFIPAQILQSAGYTTASDGTRTATTQTALDVQIQVQALTAMEVAHLDGLNIQGVMRSVYLSGDWSGAVRPLNQGGDLLVFNGQTWLITTVLESWPDWTKAAITLQTD